MCVCVSDMLCSLLNYDSELEQGVCLGFMRVCALSARASALLNMCKCTCVPVCMMRRQ